MQFEETQKMLAALFPGKEMRVDAHGNLTILAAATEDKPVGWGSAPERVAAAALYLPVPAVLSSQLPQPVTQTNSAAWVQAAVAAVRKCQPPSHLSGRGVIICAGGRYLTSAWMAIKLMRHFGSQLPVQIWHLGPAEVPEKLAAIFTPLNVEFVDARILQKTYPHKRLNGWEVKAYAMLHCPWREFILLDADNMPLQNIDNLFDSPLYRQHGALFWPDRGRWPPDFRVWNMTGIQYRDEAEFESGQLVVDHQRCWQELMLANLFNEESEFWYAHIHGDKDTFRLAWRALGTEYGMIPHPSSAPWPFFYQKDESGNLLFNHGIKWDTRPNTQFEFVPDVCNQFLAEYLTKSAAAEDAAPKGVVPPRPKQASPIAINTGLPDSVRIDTCHIDHIQGIVRALKPKNILELGVGTGATATAIIKAATSNNCGHLTLVDNWLDFSGKRPDVAAFEQSRLSVLSASEESFIRQAAPVYDFIVSDADHGNAHRWWEDTVQLARPGGCVVFHDVTNPAFENLKQIYENSRQKYATQLFNASTTPDERCERGLLVVWRGDAPAIKQPKVAVLQFATGGAAEFLDCSAPMHAHACEKYGYDYIVEREPKSGRHAHWEKQRMIFDCAARGYDFICWLDTDALWLGDTPLLDVWAAADPRAMFAGTFHGPRPNPGDHYYDHVNAGVLFVRNIGGMARYPLELWANTPDDGHPWNDQHALNKVFNNNPSFIHIVGHEWNTVEWAPEYSAPNPHIVAWHGKSDWVLPNMQPRVDAYKAKHGL